MKAFKLFYILSERRGRIKKYIYKYIIPILTMHPNFSTSIRTQAQCHALPVLVRQ